MKKAILMITAALALLLGCNESRSLLTKITITSDVKEVYVGSTAQLTASVEPADVPEAVVWSSSDEKTATVDQKGVVTGVKEGTVTVKLASKADENMCDTVEITVVKNPNPVTIASVVITDGEMAAGEEVTVKAAADENGAYTAQKAFGATVSFSDGSQGRYDETVSWVLGESDPEGAFTLSQDGVLGFSLAAEGGASGEAALGSAVVEALSNYDGTTKAAVRVSVVDAEAPDSLEIADASGYGFEGGELALFEGGSGVTAQVFVNPVGEPQEAVWSSEPARAVKILLPEEPETEAGETPAGKVLLKKGTVEKGVSKAVVTVTRGGVSARLSVSFPEAEIIPGGYEGNDWIEGETLTLTAAGSLFEVTGVDGSAGTVSDSVWTVPAPAGESESESKTVTWQCRSLLGGETFTVSLEGKVWNDTHVRYDDGIFKTVKVFDFTVQDEAKNAGVKVKRGVGGSWTEKSEWDTVNYSDGEGYTFTTNNSDGVRFVFPETDGDLDFDLIMVETKWNNSNANIHLSWWYSDADIYGYSFYKDGKSFFMLDSYNYSASNGFDASVTANTFNRFYAFDDGTNHSGRVNDGDVKSFSFSDSHTLDSFTSIQLEFNEGASCTYTLKTVAFYKAAE